MKNINHVFVFIQNLKFSGNLIDQKIYINIKTNTMNYLYAHKVGNLYFIVIYGYTLSTNIHFLIFKKILLPHLYTNMLQYIRFFFYVT